LIKAFDGLDGCEKAYEHIPDIIISDLMMPNLDGMSMIKKIKNDHRTNHIPVIVLTAKADDESKLKGLETGADAYLIKPFDKDELQIRIKNLLKLRSHLQEYFMSFKPSPELSRKSKTESEFIKAIQEIIDKNLDNHELKVQSIYKDLLMSKSQFYRKFNALTNTSINKYIQKYRLHKAFNYLAETDMNVSQVAMEVGFSNLSFFSRKFSEEFGQSPKEIRNKASLK
jgi:YesN/AraC family two-component response regulator